MNINCTVIIHSPTEIYSRPYTHKHDYKYRNNITINLRSALVWDITQRTMVIHYRRFVTNYRVPSWDYPTLEYETDTLSRNVGTELAL